MTTRPTKTTLYALGSNGQGQLGLPHKDDLSQPERCHFYPLSPSPSQSSNNDQSTSTFDFVPLHPGETLKKLVAGGNHTLLLTSSGRVFAAAQSTAVAFSRSDGPEDVKLGFKEVPFPQYITSQSSVAPAREALVTDIAATWEASFLVVDATQIYVLGTGDKGELGRGEHCTKFLETEASVAQIYDIADFEPGSKDVRVRSISACMNHVVVLTTTGNLYGWGASRKGQLGARLQAEKIVWKPTRIVLDDVSMETGIAQVVTGRDFTFIVGTHSKEYILLGAEPRGGFDLPRNLSSVFSTDNFHDSDTDTKSLRSNNNNTNNSGIEVEPYALWSGLILKSPHGQTRGFGRNNHGQLIDTSTSSGTETMVKQLAAGSEHSVALMMDGTVRAWGWGEHGNCGDGGLMSSYGGRRDGYLVFRPGAGEKVVGVGAGCATTFFWVEEGC